MARTEEEAVEKACKKYGVAKEKVKLTQGQFCIYVTCVLHVLYATVKPVYKDHIEDQARRCVPCRQMILIRIYVEVYQCS